MKIWKWIEVYDADVDGGEGGSADIIIVLLFLLFLCIPFYFVCITDSNLQYTIEYIYILLIITHESTHEN